MLIPGCQRWMRCQVGITWRFFFYNKRGSLGVNSGGAASSADLGDSSDYLSEKLEGRSGQRFRKKCIALRVSRS